MSRPFARWALDLHGIAPEAGRLGLRCVEGPQLNEHALPRAFSARICVRSPRRQAVARGRYFLQAEEQAMPTNESFSSQVQRDE